jgi:hypothetical protein
MIVLPILLLLAGLFAGEQTPTALVLVVLRHVLVRIPGSSMLTSPSIASLCQPTSAALCRLQYVFINSPLYAVLSFLFFFFFA